MAQEVQDEFVLPAFIDPITQDVLIDPVVAVDGHSYSRSAIEGWFASDQSRIGPIQQAKSPLTNAPLYSTQLVPNITLRKAIEEWHARKPMALDPARLDLSSELLGEGSFGRVMGGTLDVGGSRKLSVAVKMLAPLEGKDGRQLFDRELKAHMLAARHCDGICALFGTCEKDHKLCIVMKRYERSLAAAIAKGPMDAATVRRRGFSLCRTLRQLHDCHIVVQDLKPENILMDSHDEVVIADFGVADVIQNATRIMPSTVRGTFNYMSPEAFDPESFGGVGSRSDVWAVACVITEMLTGVRPWAGLPMQQIMTAVVVRGRVPDVPENAPAAAVLRRCFARTPSDRPSAAELADALAPPAAAESPAGALPEQLASIGAQLERLSAEKAVAVEELRELRQEHGRLLTLTEQKEARAVEAEARAAKAEARTAEVEALLQQVPPLLERQARQGVDEDGWALPEAAARAQGAGSPVQIDSVSAPMLRRDSGASPSAHALPTARAAASSPTMVDVGRLPMPQVLEALRSHFSQAEAVGACCARLATIWRQGEQERQAAASAGALEALMEGMTAHRDAARVQEQGCYCLRMVASYCSALGKKIRDAGAEGCVRAAVNAHPENTRVKSYAESFMEMMGTVDSKTPPCSPQKGEGPSTPLSAKKKFLNLFKGKK